jgi:hypothetical protein
MLKPPESREDRALRKLAAMKLPVTVDLHDGTEWRLIHPVVIEADLSPGVVVQPFICGLVAGPPQLISATG